MPDRGKQKRTILIIYIVIYGEFDALMFFDFVTFSWFIQNQVKSHAPSPYIGGNTQVVGVDFLLLQQLFQVLNG